jgi:hypothetical protein
MSDDNVELEVSHSEANGLSMKAKGAGIIILLSISIGGIVFLGYTAMTIESDRYGFLMLPMIFLLWLSNNLIAVAGTIFTDRVWEIDRNG